MSMTQEQQRSCLTCHHEVGGYCEWGIESLCPPWADYSKSIALEGGNEMGAICRVWELREEPWEK